MTRDVVLIEAVPDDSLLALPAGDDGGRNIAVAMARIAQRGVIVLRKRGQRDGNCRGSKPKQQGSG